jgi:hypothetical protein
MVANDGLLLDLPFPAHSVAGKFANKKMINAMYFIIIKISG